MDCKMEVLSFALFFFGWDIQILFTTATQLYNSHWLQHPQTMEETLMQSQPEFFVFKAYLLSSWAAILACLLIQPNWQLELVNLRCHTLMSSRIMVFSQHGYWLSPLIASVKYLLSPSITMLSNFSSWAIKSANWISFASAVSGLHFFNNLWPSLHNASSNSSITINLEASQGWTAPFMIKVRPVIVRKSH